MKKTIAIVSMILLLAMTAGCASNRSMDTPMSSASSADTYNGGFDGMGAMRRTEEAGYDMAAEKAADYEVEYDEIDYGEYDEELGMNPPTGGGDGEITQSESIDPTAVSASLKKVIYTGHISMQTTEYDKTVADVKAYAEEFGGEVQDANIEGLGLYQERGNRSASFTLRIPSARLSDFMGTVGDRFTVTNNNTNSEDITDRYFDSQARLDSLRVQETRLLEMLNQAAELQYLLQVESKLAEVRYEIESITGTLRRYDSLVAYSTVYVQVYEVTEYRPVVEVPVTFGDRLASATRDSWRSFASFCGGFVIVLVTILPFLLLIGGIVFVIVFFSMRSAKRRRLNAPAVVHGPAPMNPPAYGPVMPQQPQPVQPEPKKDTDK